MKRVILILIAVCIALPVTAFSEPPFKEPKREKLSKTDLTTSTEFLEPDFKLKPKFKDKSVEQHKRSFAKSKLKNAAAGPSPLYFPNKRYFEQKRNSFSHRPVYWGEMTESVDRSAGTAKKDGVSSPWGKKDEKFENLDPFKGKKTKARETALARKKERRTRIKARIRERERQERARDAEKRVKAVERAEREARIAARRDSLREKRRQKKLEEEGYVSPIYTVGVNQETQ